MDKNIEFFTVKINFQTLGFNTIKSQAQALNLPYDIWIDYLGARNINVLSFMDESPFSIYSFIKDEYSQYLEWELEMNKKFTIEMEDGYLLINKQGIWDSLLQSDPVLYEKFRTMKRVCFFWGIHTYE